MEPLKAQHQQKLLLLLTGQVDTHTQTERETWPGRQANNDDDDDGGDGHLVSSLRVERASESYFSELIERSLAAA